MAYIQYKGSPDVFNSDTGKYVSYDEALKIPDFFSSVQKVDTVRPDLTQESQFVPKSMTDIQSPTTSTGTQTGQISLNPSTETTSTNYHDSYGTTLNDIQKQLAENQTKYQQSITDQQTKIQAAAQYIQPTDSEKKLQADILGLQQAQTQQIEQAQEAGLDAAGLRSATQAKISNIASGNTRESLVNLRQQTFATQKLQQEQEFRQNAFEQAKFQVEQGQSTVENYAKMGQLLDQQANNFLTRVNTLQDNARQSLNVILEKFQGLTFDKLTPDSVAQIAQLAQRVGLPIDVIKQGMQITRNQIDLENAQKQQALNAKNTLYGGVLARLPTSIQNRVISIAQNFGSTDIVKKFNATVDGINLVNGISAESKNQSDHQTIVYAFAKSLDPESVVKEGEYETIKKYAQSALDKYGKEITNALVGTGFLSQSAIENIKTTMQNNYASRKPAYDSLFSQTQGIINNIAGTNVANELMVDFEKGVGDENLTLEDVEQYIKDNNIQLPAGITPQDFLEYQNLSNEGSVSTNAQSIANAIKTVESGGNYQATGGSGEYGAYQFMPSTWSSWAGLYLGDKNAPMTQANQDKVALAKINDLLKQGYNAEQIALIWNGGQPIVKKGVNQYGIAYDSGAYAQKVLNALS